MAHHEGYWDAQRWTLYTVWYFRFRELSIHGQEDYSYGRDGMGLHPFTLWAYREHGRQRKGLVVAREGRLGRRPLTQTIKVVTQSREAGKYSLKCVFGGPFAKERKTK